MQVLRSAVKPLYNFTPKGLLRPTFNSIQSSLLWSLHPLHLMHSSRLFYHLLTPSQ